MAVFSIRPLLNGQVMMPLGFALRWADMRTGIWLPVFMFLIEGVNKQKIVFEAGMGEATGGRLHGHPAQGGGEKATREALKAAGTSPEDIDILILSHLHLDHDANARLFKKARIFVQKTEWDHAFNPEPIEREHYIMDDINPLKSMNLALIEGDYKIMDGLELFYLPGHSPGHQGLAVANEKGKTMLCGDVFYLHHGWQPTISEATDGQGNKVNLPSIPGMPFWPQGNTYCFKHWYESAVKVKSLASADNLIIPTHNPELVGKKELP